MKSEAYTSAELISITSRDAGECLPARFPREMAEPEWAIKYHNNEDRS